MLLWPYQDITHRVSRCICSVFVRPFSSLCSESNLQCEVGPRKSMLIFSNAHLKEVSWLHCYCCTQALEEFVDDKMSVLRAGLSVSYYVHSKFVLKD